MTSGLKEIKKNESIKTLLPLFVFIQTGDTTAFKKVSEFVIEQLIELNIINIKK